MESTVIQYEMNGEVNEMEVMFKFLSPKLRVKISKVDQEFQKINKGFTKSLTKEEKRLYDLSKSQDTNEHILTEDESMILLGVGEKQWKILDDWNIEQFKVIVDYGKLTKEQQDLINSNPDDDFWNGVDISKITECTQFFRKTYKI